MKVFICSPLTSGRPDRGSDGVRFLINEDVRGRVVGFVGEDSVLEELAGRTANQTCLEGKLRNFK